MRLVSPSGLNGTALTDGAIAALGARARRERATDLEALTDREWHVAEPAARGLTNHQVATGARRASLMHAGDDGARSHARRRFRLAAFGAAVVVTVAMAAADPAIGHSRSQAALARSLAGDVHAARGANSKTHAMLRLLDALNVGVYRTTGRPLRRGSERRRTDLYFYDFEVQLIAEGLLRHKRSSYENLAATLNAAHFQTKRGLVTAAGMQRAVVWAIRSSMRRPQQRLSLYPLVIRELGRWSSARDDLSRAGSLTAARFDIAQSTLVLFDIMSRLRQRQKPNASTTAYGAGRRATLATKDSCLGLDTPEQVEVQRFGKFFMGMIRILSDPTRIAVIATDSVHGALLGVFVDFKATKVGQRNVTHYGPPGHPHAPSQVDAGSTMQFQVGIQMTVDLPEVLVTCGPFIGLKFPKKGGIPDIPISWDGLGRDGYDLLAEHGDLQPFPRNGKTDDHGIATLVFTPHAEVEAGVGLERHVAGSLSVAASLLGGTGSILGIPADFVGAKGLTLPWNVYFHQRLVLDADITVALSRIGGVRGAFTVTVRGLVLRQMPDGTLFGEQDLHVAAVDVAPDPGCPDTSGGGTVTPRAPLRVWFTLDRSTGVPFAMKLDTGAVENDLRITCGGPALRDHETANNYLALWDRELQSTRDFAFTKAGSVIGTITDWTAINRNNEYIARKDVTQLYSDELPHRLDAEFTLRDQTTRP